MILVLLNFILIFPLQTSTLDKKMRHKHLLMKITHRGPKAFAIFLSILMDKFPDAYDYFNHLENVYGDISLTHRRTGNGRSQYVNSNSNVRNNSVETRRESPPSLATNGNGTAPELPSTQSTANGSSFANGSSSNANGSKTDDVIELKEYTQTLQSRHNYTVQKSSKFHGFDSGSKVSTYSMRSTDRGVLFLVNIVHFDQHAKLRNGADADRDNLIALFREMGFKIFYYENLKRDVSLLTRRTESKWIFDDFFCLTNSFQEFIKLVDQLVVSSHLRSTDCLIFGLLTHGEREYASFNVEFSDLQKMDVEDILSKFSNSNCDRMVGKPKIFIFPFCRWINLINANRSIEIYITFIHQFYCLILQRYYIGSGHYELPQNRERSR